MKIMLLDDDPNLETVVDVLHEDYHHEVTWCTNLQAMEHVFWNDGAKNGINTFDFFLFDAQLDRQYTFIPLDCDEPVEVWYGSEGELYDLAGLDWFVKNKQRLPSGRFGIMTAYAKTLLMQQLGSEDDIGDTPIINKSNQDFIILIQRFLTGTFDASEESEFD